MPKPSKPLPWLANKSVPVDKEKLAKLIKEGRVAKGYTQQEVSELTGISLRSVQRIENGEVLPRAYTIRLLAEKLEIPGPSVMQGSPEPGPAATGPAMPGPRGMGSRNRFNPRRMILTIGTGLLILFGVAAFVAQSPRFPETDFERFLLTMGAIAAYMIILFRIWK